MTAVDLLVLSREKPIHFMGIGGAGMAPLAELVRLSGGRLSGIGRAVGECGGRW